MTLLEIRAFNAGVQAAIKAARQAARAVRPKGHWRSVREGAAEALEGFAEAAAGLLLANSESSPHGAAVPNAEGINAQ